MKLKRKFSPSIVESILSDLTPFDPTKFADSDNLRSWFDFFGLNRTPVALGTVLSGEFTLAVYSIIPPNATNTVIFIPGFLDHAAVHKTLINYLIDHNYAVIAVDLPGHGFSSGERGTISNFQHYGTMVSSLIDLAKQWNYPGKINLIGHSTGGAAILELIRTKGKCWSGETILVAPLIRSPMWKLSTAGMAITKKIIRTSPRIFQTTSHDKKFLEFLRHEPHCIDTFVVEWSESLQEWVPLIESMEIQQFPITVIQGTDDFTVGWRQNMKTIRHLFPNAEITMIYNGRHHLLNESPPYKNPVYDTIHSVLERV